MSARNIVPYYMHWHFFQLHSVTFAVYSWVFFFIAECESDFLFYTTQTMWEEIYCKKGYVWIFCICRFVKVSLLKKINYIVNVCILMYCNNLFLDQLHCWSWNNSQISQLDLREKFTVNVKFRLTNQDRFIFIFFIFFGQEYFYINSKFTLTGCNKNSKHVQLKLSTLFCRSNFILNKYI